MVNFVLFGKVFLVALVVTQVFDANANYDNCNGTGTDDGDMLLLDFSSSIVDHGKY